MATRMDITQSGTYWIATGPTPMVQVSGLVGQILPFLDNGVDANSVGGATVLQAIGFRSRGSQIIQPAGLYIAANDAYEFTTGGLPLWFTVTLTTTAPVTLFIFPDMPVTAPPNQVLLSNGIIIDAIPPEYDETFEIVQAWEDAGQTAGTLLP